MQKRVYIILFILFYLLEHPLQSQSPRINIDPSVSYQQIDGFGGGIKRRTEHLYALDDTLREKVEKYCFQDLEVNMIRFFVYHDIEPVNDNNDPLTLDTSRLDWRRYESDPNLWKAKYVAEALHNAFRLSKYGFDHVIGNCNSAPAWLKTNGQHNNGGTLISGQEDEYSEFLVTFIQGMKRRYGIEVTAISPTNEPDYMVPYESMNTTPGQLSSILTNLHQRLIRESLSHVQIISPECFRVESNNPANSTTHYITSMFGAAPVSAAVDIVATHTYADKNHNANWNRLKVASANKPIWVTESSNLHSTDQSMTDAAHYIKWILRGFNEGGITAYMVHLFYEEADNTDGYSSLVAWTPTGQIILPKRYFAFQHFSNLIRPGYQRIHHQVFNSSVMAGAFKSPDEKTIVLQVFNEGSSGNISLKIPTHTRSIAHFVTSDANNMNFMPLNDLNLTPGDSSITVRLASLSMHSFVFELDAMTALSELSNPFDPYLLYPNPSQNNITLGLPERNDYDIQIYHADGEMVFARRLRQAMSLEVDISSYVPGHYFVAIQIAETGTRQVIKFLKL